jgi:hypothetical protein
MYHAGYTVENHITNQPPNRDFFIPNWGLIKEIFNTQSLFNIIKHKRE